MIWFALSTYPTLWESGNQSSLPYTPISKDMMERVHVDVLFWLLLSRRNVSLIYRESINSRNLIVHESFKVKKKKKQF